MSFNWCDLDSFNESQWCSFGADCTFGAKGVVVVPGGGSRPRPTPPLMCQATFPSSGETGPAMASSRHAIAQRRDWMCAAGALAGAVPAGGRRSRESGGEEGDRAFGVIPTSGRHDVSLQQRDQIVSEVAGAVRV